MIIFRFVLWLAGYLAYVYVLYSIGSYLHVDWNSGIVFVVGAILTIAVGLLLAWLIGYIE